MWEILAKIQLLLNAERIRKKKINQRRIPLTPLMFGILLSITGCRCSRRLNAFSAILKES